MFTDRYLRTAQRLLILVLLYSFCRVLFFLFNYKTFTEANAGSVFLSFLYGLRFDLSIIFSSNLLFILISILPFSLIDSPTGKKLLKFLFLFVNIPLLFLNLVDIEYFKFTLKRTGYDVIGILGDVQNQSLQLAFHYWYIPVLLIAILYVLIRFYNATLVRKESKPIPRWISVLAVPVVIGLSVLIIRGGLQYKPMKPDHAFVQSPNVLGNLVLNTPYNFFTTLSFPRVENSDYYKSAEDIKVILKKDSASGQISQKGANVVIIILESFSREYMGLGSDQKGYTPFLDSLASNAAFFDHHFANGRRSIEAVPSIFASIPALMEEPYITGIYQGNEIHGLAEILSENGYTTAFFHGGRNGTMGFDKFSMNAGFKSYYGLEEYPEAKKEKDFDGNWGIYDEPYLDYFCTELSSFKTPFLASVFTLSSHQPYSVPDRYKGKFPKGTLEIHESIGYADNALRNFFNSASKQSWYKNTLFVITADHTQGLSTPEYQNTIGAYRVPLVLFQPGEKIVADLSQTSQHLDILPTVLDYVGIQNRHPLLFGHSLLDSSEGCALFYSNQSYYYVKKDYYLEFDGKNSKLYLSFDWNKKREVTNQPSVKERYEKELKAYIQYYNNGLNANNWYRFAD
jgi:phosphoglycerol transferase MdoB-like AlkP superfamily enzyme